MLRFEGRKGKKYDILVNPYPIFPDHLVIAKSRHTDQSIWHRYIDMLDLDDGQKYTLFKSIYPKDDTYNQAIIDYIERRKDLTATEKRKMLAKLELS